MNPPPRHRLPREAPGVRQQGEQATLALVFALEVTVESQGKDKYGRCLRRCPLADGTNVNQELVVEGCVGGIRNMPQRMSYWQPWKRRREWPEKDWGLSQAQCHRGSGRKGAK